MVVGNEQILIQGLSIVYQEQIVGRFRQPQHPPKLQQYIGGLQGFLSEFLNQLDLDLLNGGL